MSFAKSREGGIFPGTAPGLRLDGLKPSSSSATSRIVFEVCHDKNLRTVARKLGDDPFPRHRTVANA